MSETMASAKIPRGLRIGPTLFFTRQRIGDWPHLLFFEADFVVVAFKHPVPILKYKETKKSLLKWK